jgi:hypothetical protein
MRLYVHVFVYVFIYRDMEDARARARTAKAWNRMVSRASHTYPTAERWDASEGTGECIMERRSDGKKEKRKK